jgi:hypothetical protein
VMRGVQPGQIGDGLRQHSAVGTPFALAFTDCKSWRICSELPRFVGCISVLAMESGPDFPIG